MNQDISDWLEKWLIWENHWDEPEQPKKGKPVSGTYKDIFTIYSILDDKYVCVSHNDFGDENETLVHIEFLKAHGLRLGDSFLADIDYGNSIVLETIKKLEDY